jgi:hypothetical protein
MLLAKLGERGVKPPQQPVRTVEQAIEDMLNAKRELFERDDVASNRNFRRLEFEFVKALKEHAASLGSAIAMDGPKWSAKKLALARDDLKYSKRQVADFEAKLTKLGGG